MDRTTVLIARRRGFSLLELVLVMVILGLLAGVATFAIGPAAGRAKVRTTKTSMENIKSQITAFEVQKSRLPDSLDELITAGYLEDKVLKDGWSNEFYYRPTPNSVNPYELVSAGPDGELATEDDLEIWTIDHSDDQG